MSLTLEAALRKMYGYVREGILIAEERRGEALTVFKIIYFRRPDNYFKVGGNLPLGNLDANVGKNSIKKHSGR